jgi:acetyl esterase/lipase
MKSARSGWLLSIVLCGCGSSGTTPPPDDVESNSAGSSSTTGSTTSAGGSSFSAVPGASTSDDAAPGAVEGVDASTASSGGSAGANGDAAANASSTDAAEPNEAGRAAFDASRGIDSSASSGADSGPLAAPVSDKTSTLGISAAGAGYHVEGNIPYGPFAMQRLDVIYPNGAGPTGTTSLPGVIMFHGGGWTDNRPQALKASMSSFFNRFLQHGFLVCNVEYRLADGTANGAIAPAADQDALLAAQWFWNYMDYYHVDRTKYVVTGASAGGQLALMVGMATAAAQLGPTSPTDYSIAAIVNGYGPSDVTDLLAKNISWAVQWLPASTPNRAALAVQVSPVTYVRKDVPPLITVQGSDDTTVPTTESQNLFNLLTAAGADTALHFVAGAGHGFDTPATAWPDAEATMFAFLTARGIGH